MGDSSKTFGLWTMQVGEREASLQALEGRIVAQGGNPRELFDLFRTDKAYTDRIAQAMIRKGFTGSIELPSARAALRRNIFTDVDWMTYYNARFTKRQIRDAGKFPWSEDVLNSSCPFNPGSLVKDTHFAFLGTPTLNGKSLTVARWLMLHPNTGQPCFYYGVNPWHAGQYYTDAVVMSLRWYLMLREIVPGSTNKTPAEQAKMLPPEYEVPTTIAEVTKDILVFRKMNWRPNSSYWAACAENTLQIGEVPGGQVSCVGSFGDLGLQLMRWDASRTPEIGVGASRKF